MYPEHIQIEYLEPVAPPAPPTRRACLVAGCPCKDARIVSHRRAAFFAAIARRNGETADRFVAADPAWPIAALFAASRSTTEAVA